MSECAFVPDWPDLPGHIGVLSTLRTGGVSHFPYSDLAGSNGLNLGSHVGDQPEHVMQLQLPSATHNPIMKCDVYPRCQPTTRRIYQIGNPGVTVSARWSAEARIRRETGL